jgi:hypothetical protein
MLCNFNSEYFITCFLGLGTNPQKTLSHLKLDAKKFLQQAKLMEICSSQQTNLLIIIYYSREKMTTKDLSA